MFDSIRKHQRLWLAVLLILILPAFVLFGISGYDRMLSGDRAVATVRGQPITPQEFEAAQRQQLDQMRNMLGSAVDPKLLDSPEARSEILEGLIARRVLVDEANRRHVIIPDERLRQTILSIPGLKRDDGSFDDARYKALLSSQNMTAAGFENQLRLDLALQMLPESVQGSTIVPRSVVDRLIALQEESRVIREQRFDAAAFESKVAATEAQIAAWFEANARQFETPESARVEYVVLSRDEFARRVTLSTEDLRTYYEQNAARFGAPEERRASHILIKAGPQAREQAQALLEQLRKDPARFEALARSSSDDPGSAPQGGDLGWFGRSMMVKPFADAAFEMKEGELRGPVETEFGQHLIRLTGVRGGQTKPFDAVRAEIEGEVRNQLAARQFAEAAESFTNMVYEQSESLKPVAEKFQLEIVAADGVGRTPGAAAEPGSALATPRLLAALFSDDVLRNKRNTEAVEIAPGRLAAARVVEHRPPQRQTLETVRDEARRRFVAEEAARLAKEAGEARLAALKAGGADASGFGEPRTVSRAAAGGLVRPALEAVFRLPVEPMPAFTGVALGQAGYVVIQLVKVAPPDPQLVAQRREAYAGQIGRIVAQDDAATSIQALKRRSDVVRHPERLGGTTTN